MRYILDRAYIRTESQFFHPETPLASSFSLPPSFLLLLLLLIIQARTPSPVIALSEVTINSYSIPPRFSKLFSPMNKVIKLAPEAQHS